MASRGDLPGRMVHEGVASRGCIKWWHQVPFTPGFWSFAFAIAALATDIMICVQKGGWPVQISWVALAVASASVAWLGFKTLELAAQRRLIPPA